MRLAEVQSAKRNPKRHSEDIGASIGRFGYADGVILDERTGRLVAGHGRLDELRRMQAEGEEPPDGIRVNGEDWLRSTAKALPEDVRAPPAAASRRKKATRTEGGRDA